MNKVFVVVDTSLVFVRIVPQRFVYFFFSFLLETFFSDKKSEVQSALLSHLTK